MVPVIHAYDQVFNIAATSSLCSNDDEHFKKSCVEDKYELSEIKLLLQIMITIKISRAA